MQDNWGREVGKEQDRASQMAHGNEVGQGGQAVPDNWGRRVGKEQDRAGQIAQGNWGKGVRKGADVAWMICMMGVCVECVIGKQKKPILFKVTEPSSIPYRT